MAINKVDYGDENLIDLTDDTISEEDVLKGVSFHSADGESRVGKALTGIPQLTELPQEGGDALVQYIGEDSVYYKHGYFYQQYEDDNYSVYYAFEDINTSTIYYVNISTNLLISTPEITHFKICSIRMYNNIPLVTTIYDDTNGDFINCMYMSTSSGPSYLFSVSAEDPNGIKPTLNLKRKGNNTEIDTYDKQFGHRFWEQVNVQLPTVFKSVDDSFTVSDYGKLSLSTSVTDKLSEIDKAIEDGFFRKNIAEINKDGDIISIYGGYESTGLKFIEKGDYTVSYKCPSKTAELSVYSQVLGRTFVVSSRNPQTFRLSQDDYVSIWIDDSSGDVSDIQLEKGSEATEYVVPAKSNVTLTNDISLLQSNFQAGVDGVYNAVVAKGSTPASKSLSDVIEGIENIPTGITPTGKYTYPVGSTGGDVDITNYATVNASNVYSKGNADGQSTAKITYEPKTLSATNSGGVTVKNASGSTILTSTISNSYDKGVSDGRVGYIVKPTAKKSITANGTGIDVLNYATVDVNVPSPIKGRLKLLAYEARTGTRKLNQSISVSLSAGEHILIPMFTQGTTSQTSANQGHTAYFGHISSISGGATIVEQGPEMSSSNINQTSTEYYCKVKTPSSGTYTITITQNVLSAHTSYGQGYFLYELI